MCLHIGTLQSPQFCPHLHSFVASTVQKCTASVIALAPGTRYVCALEPYKPTKFQPTFTHVCVPAVQKSTPSVIALAPGTPFVPAPTALLSHDLLNYSYLVSPQSPQLLLLGESTISSTTSTW